MKCILFSTTYIRLRYINKVQYCMIKPQYKHNAKNQTQPNNSPVLKRDPIFRSSCGSFCSAVAHSHQFSIRDIWSLYGNRNHQQQNV